MTRAELGPDPHRADEGPEGLRWLPSSPLYLQLPELSELEALLYKVNLGSGQPGLGAIRCHPCLLETCSEKQKRLPEVLCPTLYKNSLLDRPVWLSG